VEAEVHVGAPLGAGDLGIERSLVVAIEVAMHLDDGRDAAERRRSGLGRVVGVIRRRIELNVRIDRPREDRAAARIELRPVEAVRGIPTEHRLDGPVAADEAAADLVAVRIDERGVAQPEVAAAHVSPGGP